jgi:hypothetical protein
MKIIISHDVDHLFPKDHIFRDLIIPKFWIRSFGHLLQRKIKIVTFWHRLAIIFQKKWHCIDEMMAFDKAHAIPSVFFFGMDNILGMSYKKKEVAPIIKKVMNCGFDIGVHGVEIDDMSKIKKEYDEFTQLSGLHRFGIRTHYVRYHETTFQKFDKTGYLFDTSVFNKKELQLQAPYKIGNMWEFPLHIMDGYVLTEGLQKAKVKTVKAFEEAESIKLEYFTFLFHDPLFNEKTEPEAKEYYEWFVNECKIRGFSFISYHEAIKELENNENIID